MNRKSTIVSGRTIGERREHLETKNERVAARKKDKQKKAFRVSATVIGFAILALILIVISSILIHTSQSDPIKTTEDAVVDRQPTIEIIDEDTASEDGITGRMRTYIGALETELRSLGYHPTKAIIPTGSIRLIHIYLDGYTGYIKYTIDRGPSVSAEDTDRLIRHLAGQGITDFEYLDVRIPGRAFWK